MKKILALGSILGSSAIAFAQEAGKFTVDTSNADTMVNGLKESISTFATGTLFPAILVILGVIVSIVLAMWAYRQIRKWMAAR